MATLLYKLGRAAAKRAWLVISSWLVILLAAGGWALTSGGSLSSSLAIDGVESQLVVDRLQENFEEASRGSGRVVFYKADGSALSEADQKLIAATLKEVEQIDGVAQALNPFEVEAEIEDSRQQLITGKTDAEKGRAELEKNETELANGLSALEKAKSDLEAQKSQLESGLAQAQAAGAPPAQIAALQQNLLQLEAGLKQVSAQLTELEAAKQEIAKGYEELSKAEEKIAIGERLLAPAKDFRTVSEDGSVALATIQFDVPLTDVEETVLDEIVSTVKASELTGISYEFSQELTRSLSEILGVGELIGLAIAAIVLFVMLGTLIGAGLPVISAVVGVAISAAVTFALAANIEMTSTTPVLGVMLGLAVGIDYSLFIVNRHRKQLISGIPIRESIPLANGTSGNAVLFAGLTVIIALLALNLTGISFIELMGTMGAVAILISVLVAITLVPAILRLVGMRILSKKERAKLAEISFVEQAYEPKNAHKPIFANKHPWITLVATIGVLVVAAVPAASLRLGLPDGSSEPEYSSPYKAHTITTEAFGAGFNGQISTVVTMPEAIAEDDLQELQADIANQLFELSNVAAVVPAAVSDDDTTLLFQVVPALEPLSEETNALVYEIRGLENEFADQYEADLGVTGLTASNIDISKKLGDVLPLYLGTVIALSLVLLILVFRSILVPLLAAGGFLLTVFATLGTVVAVYQWGWLGDLLGVYHAGPILSFLPIFLIGILFGLAMDYQLFLVSGIREAYTHSKDAKDSINYGIHLSRAVVIAAALIMISVFGSFAYSHLAMIRPVGFGLAVGVLVDAFIVRLLFIPAAMSVLGNSAWWIPKWLDRILPDVDVEGAKLERKRDFEI